MFSDGRSNARIARHNARPGLTRWLLTGLLFSCIAAPTLAQQGDTQSRGAAATDAGYETPIAGEEFHTTFAGRKVDVPAENRRSVTAWDLGLAYTPGLSKNEIVPIGSIYIWRNPENAYLLRATLAGVFNDVFYARPIQGGGLEYVATFENFTVPFDQAEFIDGNRIEQEELTYGHVRLGAGLGWREAIGPGYQDNMRAASLTLEPGYFYFNSGDSVASDFVTPESNFETRLHARLRWDALERNLLELAHQGYAFGADFVLAHRSDWDDWGRNGQEDGDGHQQYGYANAYLRTASGIPGVASERHRFLSSLHGGVGNNLDRFSAPRLGGAPQSDEYGAIARPVIPGALVREFFPNHYAVATAEYRYEATFFSYVGLRGSLAYLDRKRRRGGADFPRENDVLGSIGARVTTGFLFETRLQMEYNYNTEVIRDNDAGGHNVVLHVSGSF